MNCGEAIQSLLADLEAIEYPYPKEEIDKLEKRSRLIIKKFFGEMSSYLKEIEEIFHPSFGVIYLDASPETYQKQHIAGWENKRPRLFNTFVTILEDYQMSASLNEQEEPTKETIDWGRQVFLVHGHNGELKEAVARILEKLKFHVIILHEQPDGGKTIIEKLLTHAENAGFAVVLATADDLGFSRREQCSDAKYRARQNVILELGIFVAKLGRDRVFLLREDGVEMPSDFAGVLYTPSDSSWPTELAQELQNAGYEVDANLLLRR